MTTMSDYDVCGVQINLKVSYDVIGYDDVVVVDLNVAAHGGFVVDDDVDDDAVVVAAVDAGQVLNDEDEAHPSVLNLAHFDTDLNKRPSLEVATDDGVVADVGGEDVADVDDDQEKCCSLQSLELRVKRLSLAAEDVCRCLLKLQPSSVVADDDHDELADCYQVEDDAFVGCGIRLHRLDWQ